jgi:hypothetical protein
MIQQFLAICQPVLRNLSTAFSTIHEDKAGTA